MLHDFGFIFGIKKGKLGAFCSNEMRKNWTAEVKIKIIKKKLTRTKE